MYALSAFAHPRLPLGSPIHYAGLAGHISGRTFGRLELYDIEVITGEHRQQFLGLAREEFTINFGELSNGSK